MAMIFSRLAIPIRAARLCAIAVLIGIATSSAIAGDEPAPVAAGGAQRQATFIPFRDRSNGAMVAFTGQELQQLPSLIGTTQAPPSFDCSRARGAAENAICASPELAALDSGLNWLWRKIEHSPAEMAAQTRWLAARDACQEPQGPVMSQRRCVEQVYVARIKEIAPKAPSFSVGSGRYTSDTPLRLPQEETAATLMRKYLSVRGYSVDEIAIDGLGAGNARIAGFASGANGHLCSLAQTEAATKRAGAVFRVGAEGDEADLVVTPELVIVGNTRFQCGARAAWSQIYYRQPDELIGELKPPLDMNDPG